MNINIKGLREQLRNFEEDGMYVAGVNWSVARGGYDLDWELCYKGEPVLNCICNELINIGMEQSVFKKICQIIIDEYDTNPYYPMRICEY